MTLRDYIKSLPLHERKLLIKRIADHMGVSESTVRHWIIGSRKIDPARVLKLEKFFKGKVSRHDLRPDIYPL
jgi:DNA-binding transcriptional regulator YdaS (Cro superfamily)